MGFIKKVLGGAKDALFGGVSKTNEAKGSPLEGLLANQVGQNIKGGGVHFNAGSNYHPYNFNYANKSKPYKFNFADPTAINSMVDKQYMGERADILGQANDAQTKANEAIGTRDAGARALAATTIGRDTGKALASSRNALDVNALNEIIQQRQAQQQSQAGENYNHANLLAGQQKDIAADRLNKANLMSDQQKAQQTKNEALMQMYNDLYGKRVGSRSTSTQPSIFSQYTTGVANVAKAM